MKEYLLLGKDRNNISLIFFLLNQICGRHSICFIQCMLFIVWEKQFKNNSLRYCNREIHKLVALIINSLVLKIYWCSKCIS